MASPQTSDAHNSGRNRNRPSLGPRTERTELAVQALTSILGMSPTFSAADLAARLGWEPGRVDQVLKTLERSAFVESWPDPDRPGSRRFMLSTKALARIGVSLAQSGDRWNPDRPSIGSIQFRRRG